MVKEGDLENLILPLLQLLADAGVDYHIFFRALCNFKTTDAEFAGETGPYAPPPVGFQDFGNRRESFVPNSSDPFGRRMSGMQVFTDFF